MKFLIITLFSIVLLTGCGGGSTKKIMLSTASDAKIIVDGKQVAVGSTKLVIPYRSELNVKIEKTGYITEERTYVNSSRSELPKKEFVKLSIDDAIENSFTTDVSNRDIDIKTTRNEEETWKLMSQIISNHFDIIEVTDRNTGYMRTAWVTKTFNAATIRTRLVIKLGNSNPLIYKVKILSEIAKPNTSAKQDESFRAWDRLLRVYEPVVSELQSRLTK